MDQRLETFLTVCATMNYRKAAEQLHLTQPAVTKQIQALEALYGVRLFTYDSRKLRKTAQGETLEIPSASAIRTRSCAVRSNGRRRRAFASARRSPSATISCCRRSSAF